MRTMEYTWYGVSTPSIECLHLTKERGTLRALSTGANHDGHYAYAVTLTPGWVFRELTLHGYDDRQLEVRRNRDGTWSVNQKPRLDLKGAVDIDLAFSPFTNTLPVRRLSLPVGGRAEIITGVR